MNLKLIVVREQYSQEAATWLSSAWDEYTIDENPEGYAEDLHKAIDQHGGQNVRIVNVKVPDTTFEDAFEQLEVEGEVEGVETPEEVTG